MAGLTDTRSLLSCFPGYWFKAYGLLDTFSLLSSSLYRGLGTANRTLLAIMF